MPSFKELRRIQRSDIAKQVYVVDALTGMLAGRLVNITEVGFMLIGNGEILEDHVYQLIFNLQEAAVSARSETLLSLGAECLWRKETDSGSQYWVGFRTVDIGDEDRVKLESLLSILA